MSTIEATLSQEIDITALVSADATGETSVLELTYAGSNLLHDILGAKRQWSNHEDGGWDCNDAQIFLNDARSWGGDREHVNYRFTLPQLREINAMTLQWRENAGKLDQRMAMTYRFFLKSLESVLNFAERTAQQILDTAAELLRNLRNERETGFVPHTYHWVYETSSNGHLNIVIREDNVSNEFNYGRSYDMWPRHQIVDGLPVVGYDVRWYSGSFANLEFASIETVTRVMNTEIMPVYTEALEAQRLERHIERMQKLSELEANA